MKLIRINTLANAQHNILYTYRGDEIVSHIAFPIQTHYGDWKIMAVEDNLNAGEIVNIYDSVDQYIEDLEDADIIEEKGDDGELIRKRWDQF